MIERKCNKCSKKFYVYPYVIKKGWGIYCSNLCKKDNAKSNLINGKGKFHAGWKGDKIGYFGIHRWLYVNYGKADHCSFDSIHKSKRFNWANVSGHYLRDINDWIQLCAKCHKQYDMRLNHNKKYKRIYKGGWVTL